jgi:hypothetical protein
MAQTEQPRPHQPDPVIWAAEATTGSVRLPLPANLYRAVVVMAANTIRPIRCAIYTRKSTEHGLELEFNSLDAQRDACEAYII